MGLSFKIFFLNNSYYGKKVKPPKVIFLSKSYKNF